VFESSLKLSLHIPKWFNMFQVLRFFWFLLRVSCIIFACTVNTDFWQAIVACTSESRRNCSKATLNVNSLLLVQVILCSVWTSQVLTEWPHCTTKYLLPLISKVAVSQYQFQQVYNLSQWKQLPLPYIRLLEFCFYNVNSNFTGKKVKSSTTSKDHRQISVRWALFYF